MEPTRNKTNAIDQFVQNMKTGLDQYYARAISDNIKRALAQKKAKLAANPKSCSVKQCKV